MVSSWSSAALTHTGMQRPIVSPHKSTILTNVLINEIIAGTLCMHRTYDGRNSARQSNFSIHVVLIKKPLSSVFFLLCSSVITINVRKILYLCSWRFLNGSWQKGSSSEDNADHRHVFVHFTSLAPGSQWMQEPLSFAKLKLSNRENGSQKVSIYHSCIEINYATLKIFVDNMCRASFWLCLFAVLYYWLSSTFATCLCSKQESRGFD